VWQEAGGKAERRRGVGLQLLPPSSKRRAHGRSPFTDRLWSFTISEDFGGYGMREKAITPFSYCPVNFFQALSDGGNVGLAGRSCGRGLRFYFAI
jgi:hypothetical protein